MVPNFCSVAVEAQRIDATLPFLGGVIGRGFWTLFALSLFMSPGMMYLLALVFERRVLWPREQYYGFLYGDIALGVGIATTAQLAAGLTAAQLWSRTWHGTALITAVTLGLFLWYSERHDYPLEALLSPTKIWHNAVLYGAFGYWLLGIGLPVVWHYKLADARVALVLSMIIVWGALNATDHLHPGVRVAHVNFDWRHMRPQ